MDGRFYLATSTFEYHPGLPVFESDDLVSRRLVSHAVTAEQGFDFGAMGDSKGLYAPAISHHDGLFWIACTLVDGDVDGDGDGGPDGDFYVTAPSAAGPWSRPTWLPEADGFDPSLLLAGGRAWWCATRTVKPRAYEGQTEVWVRDLDVASGRLIGEETVIWRTAVEGAVWGEAPHLFARDGWTYLLTAEGGTFRDHAVVIGRSRSVTGPFENCPRTPVLSHRHLGAAYPVQNVGHADLVERADGSWAAVMLAVRIVDDAHILARETFLAEVEWEHSWPVVNPGTGVLQDVGDRPEHWVRSPRRSRRTCSRCAGPPSSPRRIPRGCGSPPPAIRSPGRALPPRCSTGSRTTTRRCWSGSQIRTRPPGSACCCGRAATSSCASRPAWTASGSCGGRRARMPSSSSARAGRRRSRPSCGPAVCGSERTGCCRTRSRSTCCPWEVAGGFVGTVWGPFLEGPAGASAVVAELGYTGRVTG